MNLQIQGSMSLPLLLPALCLLQSQESVHYLMESGSPWHAKQREWLASQAAILTMKPLKAENKEMLQPKTTPLSKGMVKRKLKVNNYLSEHMSLY